MSTGLLSRWTVVDDHNGWNQQIAHYKAMMSHSHSRTTIIWMCVCYNREFLGTTPDLRIHHLWPRAQVAASLTKSPRDSSEAQSLKASAPGIHLQKTDCFCGSLVTHSASDLWIPSLDVLILSIRVFWEPGSYLLTRKLCISLF